MKPRYSILTLLGVTAYVALAITAALNPLSAWRRAWLVVWLLAVAYPIVLALNATDLLGRVFGRVAIACGAFYLILPLVAPNVGYGGPPDAWL